jgi:hypothetical protein
VRPDELGFPFLFLPPAAFCKGVGLGERRLGSVVRLSQEKGARESLDAQQHSIRLMPSDAEAAHASRGEDGYAPDALCIPSASNFQKKGQPLLSGVQKPNQNARFLHGSYFNGRYSQQPILRNEDGQMTQYVNYATLYLKRRTTFARTVQILV